MRSPVINIDWESPALVERAHARTSTPTKGDLRSPFERDRGRIIHSLAFRRLQGKSQIFAAGAADHLRTRVTHSIEVAQIGRALALRFGVPESLVEAACLGHDVGHPPFGHTGEKVLDDCMTGIGGFEGNAQTFRVLTRLESKHRDYEGLDLCRATLLGVIKYPFRASAETGKYLYDDDADTLEGWLFEGSGQKLIAVNQDTADPPRSIVCQLMDWADDVAYAVHDLEDGIAYGFLSPREWAEDFFVDGVYHSLQTAPVKWPGAVPGRDAVGSALKDLADQFGGYSTRHVPRDIMREFSSNAIDRLVTPCEVEARGSGESVFDYELVVPESTRFENIVMKQITYEFMIRDARTSTVSYKGTEVIRRLYDVFVRNAMGETEPIADRYILFPREHRHEVETLGYDEAHVGRWVCDYLASMTEGQAMALYSRLFEPGAGFSAGT